MIFVDCVKSLVITGTDMTGAIEEVRAAEAAKCKEVRAAEAAEREVRFYR